MADRRLIALPLLFSASTAQAELRPVENKPYRYDTVETRGDGMRSDRFATHRTLVFHREQVGGWIAEVTLDSIERPDQDVGAMFAAANAGLLHRTIRFHLDAAGKVTGIDDADAIWTALLGGMDAMAGKPRGAETGRPSGAQAMANPLRALPPERRQAMLASVLAPLLAPAAIDGPDGVRPVTLPTRPPAPPGSSLTGTESVSHASNGTVTIKVEAATPPEITSAHISSVSIRNIDPATGLLEDARETKDVSVPTPDKPQRILTETVITLHLAP